MTTPESLSEDIWKKKLAAWLHDPPGKPFDIAGHYFASESLMRNFGLTHADFKEHSADHVAAAADRFPFPHHTVFRSEFTGGAESPFRHPFGGGALAVDTPFPSAEKAEEQANLAFTGDGLHGVETWKEKFWLLWRRWPEQAAEQDSRLAFLPADTRIPDHTIWNHNSIVSALEGCREGDGLKPAFLIFQAGPVQSFIAEARSTRDLWSGSYLLSWLMARALHEVACLAGPDAVMFPALRGLPLLDVMNKAMWDKVRFGDETLWQRMYPGDETSNARLLSPTIPNRFLVLVPQNKAEEIARAAEAAFRSELASIGSQAWETFALRASEAGHPLNSDARKRYERQLELWPQIAWQVLPWGEPAAAEALWEKLPKKEGEFDPVANLEAIRKLARETKGQFLDKPASKQGQAWSAYVALCDMALAARRNTRDFAAFDTDSHQAGAPKDPLTGREEIIGSEDLWRALREKDELFGKENPGLGALSILKRLWCRAETGILGNRLELRKWDLIDALSVESMEDVTLKNENTGNGYVAVLALDGDEMGKWVSGAKCPELDSVFSKEAKAFYKDKTKGIHRPLSPSYHLQFSEALATFATRFVDPIVRDYGGHTILAGGDDVLAILPADKALRCAAMLRAAFRGEPLNDLYEASKAYMWDDQDRAWRMPFDPWDELGDGWVHERVGDKNVPRAVPGPKADVSVGIAVGHFKHPLQQLVKAAQAAEKVAKNDYGRAACQVRLLKRGGEEIHWGFKWVSAALPLYVRFSELSKPKDKEGKDQKSIAGKFPSTLASRFRDYGFLSSRKKSFDSAFLDQLPGLLKLEFADVLKQQASEVKEQWSDLQDRFDKLVEDRPSERKLEEHAEDILNLFLASAFLHRQSGEDA